MFGAFALGVPHSPEGLRDAVASLGPLAPILFALGWTLLTPALASGTVLALGAGLSFGAVGGTCVGLVGATVGGVLAFAIARGLGSTAFDQLAGARLVRIRERVERRGFLTVLWARMAPGVPATLLNYACGLSRVRLRDFVGGTMIGGAPRIAAYAALGASGGRLWSAPALIALGAIAALGVAIPLSALWRRGRPVPA
jgi:uncharacterized membrane protein YdjX (TVP38/TMEM64 family)